MKRKTFIILGAIALCFMTGCSKTPELNYSGKDILHSCSSEDVNLFKEDVNVNITEKQEFVMTNNSDEMKGYTAGLLEFNEENRPDVKECYFVSYDEFEENYGSTTNITVKDETGNRIKVSLGGTYTYKVKDSQTFIKNYTDAETLKNKFNAHITAVYIANMNGKTYQDMISEKEYSDAYLQAVNNIMSQYGVEVTKVTVEITKK